jgi:hypothetical protein
LIVKTVELQEVIDGSASDMMGQYINNYLLLVYFDRFLVEQGMELPPALAAVKLSQETEFNRLGLNVEIYLEED